MLRKRNWTVKVEGIEHNVEFKSGIKCKVIVDGEEEILKSKSPFIIVIDKIINLGSKKANLVVLGANADLAVDGFFLNSKREYAPVEALPMWTWFFVAVCTLPVIVFLGGIINIGMAAIGASLCLANSAAHNRSKIGRFIINIIITTFVWSLDLFILRLVSSL